MTYLKHLFCLFAILISGVALSQQETNYNLYRYTMNIVNPAYAGADSNYNFTANIRGQWINIKDAPKTQSFFYSQPLGENIGIGVSFVSDQVFIERQTSFNLDVSYKLKVFETANLFFGIKAGGSSYNLDTADIITPDPALNTLNTGFKPNIGAGIYLKHDNYFVALSVPSLFSNKRIENNSGIITQATEEAHVYFSSGYNFKFKNDIEFRPSIMTRYVSGAPISSDLTAAVRFLERFEIGASYRTDGAYTGFAMINLAEWFAVGFSYENSTRSEISNNNNGTQEVLLQFKHNPLYDR